MYFWIIGSDLRDTFVIGLLKRTPNFSDDIFHCIFLNEKCCILTQLSLKFVSNGPVDDISAFDFQAVSLEKNRQQMNKWTNGDTIP